jgi:bisphosphoglycerate-independent phosphoglycerate mutase (AlkP superfamily)
MKFVKKTEKTEDKVKATNPDNVKKAVSLGKELSKKGDMSKVDVAVKMYEFLKDEPREVVAQAFVDGAGLTPKGAMTYVYNVKRKVARASQPG